MCFYENKVGFIKLYENDVTFILNIPGKKDLKDSVDSLDYQNKIHPLGCFVPSPQVFSLNRSKASEGQRSKKSETYRSDAMAVV